jgi:CHAT domain-containing protein
VTVYPIVGDHVSVALLVSHGNVSVVALPGVSRRQMLELRGEYLRNQVHGGAAWHKTLRNVTSRLWSLLMEPITARLDAGSPFTIVNGGLLAGLPLHAAWRPDGAGPRYVLDDYCVRYAPNAQILATVSSEVRGAQPPGSILIVQDPRPVPADPLVHARGECTAAARAFRHHTLLAAEEATVDRLRAELPRHDVVHLACHGWSDWKDPLDSGVLLAGDVITARALSIMTLSSRLVVVSACESGHPGGAVADEPLGLPAAFMELGAAAVIASSWKVNDASTFELFARFYERWPATHSASEALRLAQRDVRDTSVGDKRAYLSARLGSFAEPWPFHAAEDVPYAAPYYWAAFAYMGS